MSQELSKSRALPKGYVLSNHYIIEEVLGEGGFGITYRCRIEQTGESAAVKEYFPHTLAYRQQDSYDIATIKGQEELFSRQKEHVLREARILMELSYLEPIVNIRDVFPANHTFYLVLDLVDGITLAQYVKEYGPFSYDKLDALVIPVMRALVQVHKKGIVHRDISPENLVMTPDHKLTLIDFGSATIVANQSSKGTTVILKKGYAPPEQYRPDGNLGPWTDVYSLCATMYYALTGFPPPEAMQRYQGEELPALADYAPLKSWQAAAIIKGLSLHETDRYQTMEELHRALLVPPFPLPQERNTAKTELPSTLPKELLKKAEKQKRRKKAASLALLLCFAAAFLGAGMWFTKPSVTKPITTTTQAVTATTKATASASTATPVTTAGSASTAADSTESTKKTSTKKKKEVTAAAASTTQQMTQQKTTTAPAQSTTAASKKAAKKNTSKKDDFLKIPKEEDYDSFYD